MSCENPIFRLNVAKLNKMFPEYVDEHIAFNEEGILFHAGYRHFSYKDGGCMLSKTSKNLVIDSEPFLADFIDPCPCGRCNYCRIAHAKEFATRCMLEAKEYDESYFVTLTYNDDHLKFAPFYDRKTGKLTIEPTLVPDDLQKFMKRLRRNYERERDHVGVRFFACGEYGAVSGRPHYHLLLFNSPLDDLRPLLDSDCPTLKRSPFIEKAWKLGRVGITPVSWATAAYCARYSMKKVQPKQFKADRWYYEKFIMPKLDFTQFEGYEELLPFKVQEFQRQSNRPGLARKYFEKRINDIYTTDEVFVLRNNVVESSKVPKYFDKLFGELYPDELEEIKENRKRTALIANRAKLSFTDMTEDELAIKETEILADKVSKLVRPLSI